MPIHFFTDGTILLSDEAAKAYREALLKVKSDKPAPEIGDTPPTQGGDSPVPRP